MRLSGRRMLVWQIFLKLLACEWSQERSILFHSILFHSILLYSVPFYSILFFLLTFSDRHYFNSYFFYFYNHINIFFYLIVILFFSLSSLYSPWKRKLSWKPLNFNIFVCLFIISDDDAILVYERTLSTARKTAISGNDLLGTLLNCLTSSSIFPLGNSDKDSKDIQEREILKDGRSRFLLQLF